MRIAIKKTEVYTFDELSDEAKEQAICNHIECLMEVYQGEDDMIHDSVLEADKLQTPWFTGSIIYENHKDDVIEEIKINEYEFTVDGELYY